MSLLTNIVDYYKYDENTGTSVGDSVGSNTGTWHGSGTVWTTGKINSGGQFASGNSNYVLATISSNLSGSFSLSCWFQVSSFSSASTLFHSHVASYDNYWAELSVDNVNKCLSWNLFDGTHNPNIAGTTNEIVLNTWCHAVAIRDTGLGKIRIYFNGSQDGADVADTTTVTPTYSDFYMGAKHTGGTVNQFSSGLQDEVGIWSRVLTSGDVTSLYNAGAGSQYPFGLGTTVSSPSMSLLGVGA